jgi:Ca2+-binding EF-hand superfamily protein
MSSSKNLTRDDVERIFQGIDQDANGYIQVNELTDALGRNNFTDDEILLLVKHLDKDGDSRVSFEGMLLSATLYE